MYCAGTSPGRARSGALGEGETPAVFAERRAYVSPRNYDRRERVPTWNYLAVHAYDRAWAVEDEAATPALLAKRIATVLLQSEDADGSPGETGAEMQRREAVNAGPPRMLLSLKT